jgi:iron-sulfur cluster repair protein YtfE (RIC family)
VDVGMMRHPCLIPLSHDHHHGLALALRCRKQALGQLKPMGAEGLRQRAQEFRDFFSKELVPHFRAEEEVLFPHMRARLPESAAMIEEFLRDHETIQQAIPRLDQEAGLGKLIFDLGDLLERHIRKEERELFPLLEQHAGELDAEALGDEICKALGRPSGND